MQKYSKGSQDDYTRRYIAFLLVVPYVVLILAMPLYPGVREALVLLGPLVGYTVRYLFEVRQGNSEEG